jgi:branched-chain amino acid aminotransferase
MTAKKSPCSRTPSNDDDAMTLDIDTRRTDNSRIAEIDWNHLPFGRVYSDHMMMMDYRGGIWQKPAIVPFGPVSLHPGNTTLHYGQSIFEGMKAIRGHDGRITLFRPELNARRFNESCQRLCMPGIPEATFIELVKAHARFERDWVPAKDNAALYLRPFIFATDEALGVRPSETYKFMILSCPTGAYYAEPLSVKIEERFTRAAEGGVGRAKTAGNYAASLLPTKLANDEGFQQLIWTDGKEHQYIEESGTMNVVFVIDGTILTPSEDSDTILRSVVKRSVVDLARHWGIPVQERRISVDEVIRAIREGRLEDAFGTGTAATIAPIARIGYRGETLDLPPVSERIVSKRIKAYLDGIKHGDVPDELNWCIEI